MKLKCSTFEAGGGKKKWEGIVRDWEGTAKSKRINPSSNIYPVYPGLLDNNYKHKYLPNVDCSDMTYLLPHKKPVYVNVLQLLNVKEMQVRSVFWTV